MNIGEVARRAGLPAKTIRYYEDIGLVTPMRTANGYRRFRESDVHKLGFLGRARALGFTIEDCRTLLALWEDSNRASADVRRLATDHGHCGVIEDGEVVNDESLPLLAGMASACALSGADIVAPSDMMDGRVAALRVALDCQGLDDVAIMSYAAKYASAYYGPFREAADSAPSFGDRRSYQMDPRNVREALREVALDIEEGADIVMVKPALAYLDVIRRVREQVSVPVACYNVSGEYSMVKAAAAAGLIDEPRLVLENLHAMRRAGSDMLITYHGRDVLKGGWL